MNKRCTIEYIKSKYTNQKRKQDKSTLLMYHVFRPISFYVTWVFLKLGILANQASYIFFIVGAVGIVFLAYGGFYNRIIGAILLNFAIILDCVDGNIARYNKSTSDYGWFLDTVIGYFINIFFLMGIGLGLFLKPDNTLLIFENIGMSDHSARVILLFLGAWASLADAFTGEIYQKLMNEFPDIIGGIRDSEGSNKSTKIFVNIFRSIRLSDFYFPFLLVTAVFNYVGIFIAFYALFYTISLIAFFVRIIFKFRKV